MKKGKFYFIENDFFVKYDAAHSLMQNKETFTATDAGRPCYMAFPDENDERIFWCIPISSKIDKYKRIVEQKAQNRIKKNLPPRECDTIRFCDVLGQERAFLIQNIFPTIDKYVLCEYYDKKRNREVRISQNSEDDIIYRAQKILRLHINGANFIYTDIDTIYRGLKEELQSQDNKETIKN